MLWKYRCVSLCETQFISVVCGLAVIQKQPRLVDRAFNRASPSHFPELAFQALLQTSASLSVFHLTAPSSSYSLIHCLPFPLPCFSNSKLLLSAPPPQAALPTSPKPRCFSCSVQSPPCPQCVQHFVHGGSLPEAVQISQLRAPSHTPAGTSTNKSYC